MSVHTSGEFGDKISASTGAGKEIAGSKKNNDTKIVKSPRMSEVSCGWRTEGAYEVFENMYR